MGQSNKDVHRVHVIYNPAATPMHGFGPRLATSYTCSVTRVGAFRHVMVKHA